MDFDKMYSAQEAVAALRKAVERAYDEGYAKGQADALSAIMQAASASMGVGDVASRNTPESPAKEKASSSRAPRGSVRQAVMAMLNDRISAPTGEIVNQVHKYAGGIEISGTSASNELQRQKGKIYDQNSDGDWYLIAATSGKEKPVDDTTVESPSTGLFLIPAQGREAGPGGGA